MNFKEFLLVSALRNCWKTLAVENGKVSFSLLLTLFLSPIGIQTITTKSINKWSIAFG